MNSWERQKDINNMDPTDILGFAAGLLTTFSAAPQLYYSYKTKDVKSINLKFQVMLITGLFLWALYGFFIGSLPIMIFNFIGFSLWLPILRMKLNNKQ
jgi:MtN3 and saliva related transmembrane protein